MIRTILSLGSIMVAVAMVATGTVAFFNDTESATGNTFAAGAIDLLVDNESYYNGNKCEQVGTSTWEWAGEADYPVPGTPCTTSFLPSNLDDGLLFFNFLDVKPDDEGEDTISLHVENDAWVCMDLTLTSNDDNSSNEPELDAGDIAEDDGNPFDGELASGLEFFWWADDGDNVYEEGENAVTDGVVSLADLDATFPVALADSQNNVWGEVDGTPVPANETVYVAKAWCLGDLSLAADTQDGGDQGKSPAEVSGVICNGEDLGNIYQTDGATLDIQFSAIQSRHNDEFLCEEPPVRLGSLTIVKEVNGGDAVPADFSFTVVGPSGTTTGVQSGTTLTDLIPGDYVVSEEAGGPAGYSPDFSACDNGTVNVAAGEDEVCTVTNDAEAGSITIDKSVSFTNAAIVISIADFHLFVNDGVNPPVELVDEVTMAGLPAGTYTVSETYTGSSSISFQAQFSGDCSDDGQTGTIVLAPGGSANCSLNNAITVLPN